MNIGEAASTSGVSAKMIRYYESIGLIRAPARAASNYRVYREDEVHTLRFVKRARTLGFSIEETGELLALWRDSGRASADVKGVALKHVRELEQKSAELQSMAKTLRHLAEHCHGDNRPECPILEDLAASGQRSSQKRSPSRNRPGANAPHENCTCEGNERGQQDTETSSSTH